jgi:hypothetical protein
MQNLNGKEITCWIKHREWKNKRFQFLQDLTQPSVLSNRSQLQTLVSGFRYYEQNFAKPIYQKKNAFYEVKPQQPRKNLRGFGFFSRNF